MSTTLTPDLEAAMAAYEARDYPRAARLFTPIVDRDASNIIAWYHRGQAHHQMGDYSAAAVDLSVACRLAPNDARVWRRRAAACLLAGRDEEAGICVAEASRLAPYDAEVQHLRGGIAFNAGCTAESIDAFRWALAIDPARPESAVGLAMSLLRAGRWAEAWPLYEQRRRLTDAPANLYPDVPFWDGSDPIAGDTILVRCEQGYGDALQFARYLPRLAALGADVVLETRPALRRLFEQSFPHVHQIGEGDPPPPLDWQTSLMSLPLAFNTTPDNAPNATPYLRVDPAAWDDARHRLDKHRPNVGYCWHGAHRPHMPQARSIDERRSLPRPLMDSLRARFPRLGWTSLQEDEIAGASDWADTAALIDNLDLVITVDTAVAHLAGALNKPVWLLNRLGGCWRWLDDHVSTPWYPSMCIFTQQTAGDWAEVLERVAVALAAWEKDRG